MTATGLARLRGLRIAVVLRTFEMGGAERQALLVARGLRQHGVDVAFWALGGSPGGPVARAAAAEGILTGVVPMRWSASRSNKVRALWRLARTLRAARADILLPFTTVPNLACRLVAPFAAPRLVVWNQRDLGVERSAGLAEQYVVRRTKLFLANASVVSEYLVRSLGARSDRIRIVRNGVMLAAPARSAVEWRRTLDLGDAFVVCMVANLHREKDHVTLLRAWRTVVAQLASTGRAAALVLAGRQDDAAPSLRELAHALGVADTVRFAGAVDDIAGLLAAVDLGVLSAFAAREGCPNAVLEYMASGLSVTGTEIPAIRECVGPEAPLAPPADPDALASRIVDFAKDPAGRLAAGARNRARAAALYAPSQMYDALADALVDALGAPRVASPP
jgi:glycosyltransferase involved in cell wall biosynthesis